MKNVFLLSGLGIATLAFFLGMLLADSALLVATPLALGGAFYLWAFAKANEKLWR